MTKGDVLAYVINQFFVFDNERGINKDYSIDEFISHLKVNSSSKEFEVRDIGGVNEPWINKLYHNTLTDISILLVLMYRYAKGYIKKALRESSLNTPDEFSFLITLITYDSLTKSELIGKQVMEKTSGTEVIKRLIQSGMVVENTDVNDKRSIRVSITQAGRDEINAILPLMSKVSDIIAGTLTDEEINSLAYLLRKLDNFHNDIYQSKKNLPLNDLWSSVAR